MKKILKKILDRLGYTLILRRKRSKPNGSDYARLSQKYSSYEKLKLHFGCGPRVLAGWINIDLVYVPCQKYLEYYTDEFYGPEIRGDRSDFFEIDITKTKLPLPDSSVDVIFHEDFLEHLSQRNQFIFLAETYRVLKKGGVHRINTPDLLFSLKKYSRFSQGGEGVYTEEWDKNDHISVLTKNTLKDMAETIGYSRVLFNKRDASTSQELPKEFRPAKDRDQNEGNIFCDLIK